MTLLDMRPPTAALAARYPAAFSVLSGTILGLSFPPFPLAPLAWIALVPVILVWMGRPSARAAYMDALYAFLATFAVAFHWPLLHLRPDTALLSLPGLIVLPMWMAVPFALSVPIRRRAGVAAGLLSLCAAFVVMEWTLRRGPFAFPWSMLGHTQAELAPIHRLAAYGSVPLLTTFVLAANVLVAGLLAGNRRTVRGAGLMGLLLSAAAIVEPAVHPTMQDLGSLRVGMVQPAVPAAAWADVDDGARVERLMTLSDSLLRRHPDVDLVVWPETALPPGAEWRMRVRQWADAHGVPLLSGAIEAPGGSHSYYNSALLFRPAAGIDTYRKRRLVPFAEAVPFQERWEWIRRLAVPSGGVAGYARGAGGVPLEAAGTRFGVLICFETVFDDAARRYALDGAGFLVAITQDGWWGNSFGYRQHMAFNRLRAMELGRPLVQVAVSGYTAVLGADGAASDVIGWMDRSAAVAVVRPARTRTLFLLLGDWVSPAALLVAALSAGLAFVRSPKHPLP